MELTLGFSPCPNDTFIFDALVNQKIDTEGIQFKVELLDVQTLNSQATAGKLDVSKISYGVLPLVLNDYNLLTSGGALGKGVGPLVIARQLTSGADWIENATIAIPGENTTAHLLFSLAYPRAIKKHFMVFNQIEDAVLSGEVDAGVIIHENRFTYHDKGLVKLMDLGEHWEQRTNAPIPLGGIIIRKEFQIDVQQKIDRLIKRSVSYSFKNYPLLSNFVTENAQEMSEEVMRKHIDLYVNEFSIALGSEGVQAVQTLLNIYAQMHKLPAINLSSHLVTA